MLRTPTQLACHRRFVHRLDSTSVQRNTQRNVVACAKKKKKPRTAAEATSAPRIDLNINIPVRRQIAYVRKLEQQNKEPTVQRVPTRLRWGKKAPTAEEARADIARKQAEREAERKRGLVSRGRNQPSLLSIYGKKSLPHAPVLLVDGYNVLNIHPALQKLRDTDELDAAREKLHELLQSYAVAVQARVAVVWDAMGSELPSTAGYSFRDDGNVSIIYTTGSEADSFIVKAVTLLKERNAHWVMVATNDREQGDLSKNGGAYWMAASSLVEAMDEAGKRADQDIRLSNATQRAGTLAASKGILGVSLEDKADKARTLQAMMEGFLTLSDYDDAQQAGLDAYAFYQERSKRERNARRSARTAEHNIASNKNDHDRQGR